jgi:hypothetical protein
VMDTCTSNLEKSLKFSSSTMVSGKFSMTPLPPLPQYTRRFWCSSTLGHWLYWTPTQTVPTERLQLWKVNVKAASKVSWTMWKPFAERDNTAEMNWKVRSVTPSTVRPSPPVDSHA